MNSPTRRRDEVKRQNGWTIWYVYETKGACSKSLYFIFILFLLRLFNRQGVQDQPLTCPAEREGLEQDRDIFPDKATERKILSFAIKCQSEGCEWTGELRNKEEHSECCVFKLVLCTNENCHVTTQRSTSKNTWVPHVSGESLHVITAVSRTQSVRCRITLHRAASTQLPGPISVDV